MLYHIEEISPSYGNTLLAQGAFGEVRIGLKVNNQKKNGVSFLERRFMQKVEIVAIKTIRNSISRPPSKFSCSSWGFDSQSSDVCESNNNIFKLTKEAFCELAALRVLQPHENIVPLLDIIEKSSTELKLVFPYYPLDLYHFIHSRECNDERIPESNIRVWVKDMLKALAHCHSHGIIHGDIKPSNFLISSNDDTGKSNDNGRLKLCDFGLAQLENSKGSGSNNGLCTLHYRPPELLLGSTSVTTAVDVWSCACIIGELYNLQVIFPGRNVLDQLTRIFEQLGFNNTEEWYRNLPDSNKISFQSYSALPLYMAIPRVNENSNLEELISTMLSCDPIQRPTSQECLEHSYFFLPANTNNMMTHTYTTTPDKSSFNSNFDNLSLEEIKYHAVKVAKERRSN